MPGKKNFENIDTRSTRKAGNVEAAMNQATSQYGQQPKASEEEARNRRQNLKTQGRNGVKLKRINMAFTDDNYEFIAIVSKQKGMTMTNFVNHIVDEYRKDHGADAETLQKLKDLINQL